MKDLYDARMSTIIPMIESIHGKKRVLDYLLCDRINLESVSDVEKYSLSKFENKFGQCLQLSSLLCALLNDELNIPAILVTGDLIIEANPIFISDQDLEPIVRQGKDIDIDDWPGHSWVEIGNYIFDISLIRSSLNANSSQNGIFLNKFIKEKFNTNQEQINLTLDELDSLNMLYTPKEVLSNITINGLLKGSNLI